MGLALEEPQEKDTVETINGIKVAIDREILSQTANLTLDSDGNGLMMLGNDNCC